MIPRSKILNGLLILGAALVIIGTVLVILGVRSGITYFKVGPFELLTTLPGVTLMVIGYLLIRENLTTVRKVIKEPSDVSKVLYNLSRPPSILLTKQRRPKLSLLIFGILAVLGIFIYVLIFHK